MSIQPVSPDNPIKKSNQLFNWSGVTVIIGFAALMVFLYFDRNHGVSELIRSFGASGVNGAVLMIAVLCVTPVPSE